MHAFLPLLLLAASATGSRARSLTDSDEKLIGWKGETHHVRSPSPIEVLSWEPRAFIYRGFLSEDECDQLVEYAKPRVHRSGVVDVETGSGVTSQARTSSGAFFRRGETEMIRDIEKRIAQWTFISEEQGEGIQVLRYEPGQKYDAHHDYFFHEQAEDNGGNRMATVLMYLSDVEFGGETHFPKAEQTEDQKLHPESYSDCGKDGLAVRPRKGDALLFFSLKTTGELEQKSLHGGCPVIRGEKWSATKWIHVAKTASSGEPKIPAKHLVFAPPPPPLLPGCKDTNKQCWAWAQQGECESNPAYMLGSGHTEGACLASCGACHLMHNKDHEEMRR